MCTGTSDAYTVLISIATIFHVYTCTCIIHIKLLKYMGTMTDIQKCLDEIKPTSDAEESTPVIQVTFPSSIHNHQKSVYITRQQLRCLRQRMDNQSTGSVWLNDQVYVDLNTRTQ